MGRLDKDGILTLQELMITALATSNTVARILIEKGMVTQQEFNLKLFSERANYEGLLQRLDEDSADSNG